LDRCDRGQHSVVTTQELEFGTQKKFILGRIPKSLAILTLFSNIERCGDAVRLCASFKNGDHFMYEQGVIRPPSEARSVLVRVTRNCPWNQCLFCPAYKGVKFSRRSVAEVKADIDAMAKEYGKHAEMIVPTGQDPGDFPDRNRNRRQAFEPASFFHTAGGQESP